MPADRAISGAGLLLPCTNYPNVDASKPQRFGSLRPAAKTVNVSLVFRDLVSEDSDESFEEIGSGVGDRDDQGDDQGPRTSTELDLGTFCHAHL
jgi:hypothetical protein